MRGMQIVYAAECSHHRCTNESSSLYRSRWRTVHLQMNEEEKLVLVVTFGHHDHEVAWFRGEMSVVGHMIFCR